MQINMSDTKKTELMELLKGKLTKVKKEDFFEQVSVIYQETNKKSRKNRDKHFQLQHHILYTSAGVSILNVLVTFCSSFDFLSIIVPVITGISSVFSILVTTLIAVKSSKKYSETWLRHQKHVSDMEFEIMEYVFDSSKYKECTEIVAADLFVNNMFKIWRKNQKRFDNNMVRFDND